MLELAFKVAAAVPPEPDPTPVVTSIASDAEGAEPGRIVKGEGITISGRNFGYDGTEVGGIVCEQTDGCLKTEWPDGLDEVSDGADVAVTVTRNVGGESYTSSPVTVTVVSA